ncbi:hypothetical protein KBD33_01305 [Candidatus Gracilibacteria bacterium]|nr:hypothetical protein [Candidatus Gracilibacteria bacterium]
MNGLQEGWKSQISRLHELKGLGRNVLPIVETKFSGEIGSILETNNSEEENEVKFNQLLKDNRFKEALELCNLMIQGEVEKAFRQLDTKKYKYEYNSMPTSDSISTPTALKWKQKIGEIQDMMYSRFVEEGKTKEALELCNLMIQGEVEKAFIQLDTKKYKYEYNSMPTSDSISTPTALKWKQRIGKLTK